MTETPLNEFGIAELVDQIRRRETLSTEVVDACLESFKRHQPTINAFVAVDSKRVRAEARALDGAIRNGLITGPLHGIPIAIKDNFWTHDYPTTACSKTVENISVGVDATTVVRLREAGAIIFGKTNMHEWAYGATNEVSSFGATRNPWNPEHITGGSSGGSGAALAARIVPAALGSDTGGSVRIPAAACGVCGLKPTYGRLSSFGVLPLSWSLDVPGPMARSVQDLKILFRVLAGEHSKDTATRSNSSYSGAGKSQEMRLAVLHGEGILCNDEVRTAFDGALTHLGDQGYNVSDIEIPDLDRGFGAWKVIMLAEATTYHAEFLNAGTHAYSDSIRIQLEAGRCIAAVDYLKAQQYRSRLVSELRSVFERFDAICLPTLPVVAPKLGQTDLLIDQKPISSQDALTSMAWIANMTGLPAVSIPCGMSSSRLPIGLTLMGPAFGEDVILDIAGIFQAGTDWHKYSPTLDSH